MPKKAKSVKKDKNKPRKYTLQIVLKVNQKTTEKAIREWGQVAADDAVRYLTDNTFILDAVARGVFED